MFVSEHLDLDMPGSLDKLLDEHDLVSERLHGLSLRRLQLGLELGLGHRDPHAFAAAAANGLDHDRVADGRGLGLQPFYGLVFAMIASENEHVLSV